jgi:hypothetical protein
VEVESTEGTKKKRKKCERFFLDFENPAELDMSKFEPPQKPNSTLLVHRGGSFSSLLPVDLHYEPLNLVSLFLQSSVQVSLSPCPSLFLSYCCYIYMCVGCMYVLCTHAQICRHVHTLIIKASGALFGQVVRKISFSAFLNVSWKLNSCQVMTRMYIYKMWFKK